MDGTVRHTGHARRAGRPVSTVVAPDEVERFGDLVARSLGLRVADRPGSPLAGIIGTGAQRCGASTRQYLDRLEADPQGDEVRRLAPDLTVAESYFFRDAGQLRAFSEIALPDRVRAAGRDRPVRILSAGCATGEEPYTLAILARTALPATELSILGVDVNPAGLRAAEAGRYSGWALRGTPPEVRRRWFRPDGGDAVLDDEIRASVRFEQHNLAAPDDDLWQPGRYDIIFCRNVLMYFTEHSSGQLLGRMTQALAAGGYLFLGHAEAPRGDRADLRLRHSDGGFFFERIDTPPHAVLPAGVAPADRLAGGATGPGRGAVVGGAGQRAHVTVERAGGSLPGDRPSVGSGPLSATPAAIRPALRLLRAERFAEALDALAALPDDVRGDPAARLLTVVLRTASGDIAEAEQGCRRLLDAAPLNASVHYAMANCRHGTGDAAGAAFHSRAAADLDPGFAMPRLQLGLLARARR